MSETPDPDEPTTGPGPSGIAPPGTYRMVLDPQRGVTRGIEFLTTLLGHIAAEQGVSVSLNFYPSREEPELFTSELNTVEGTTHAHEELHRLTEGLGKLLPSEDQPSIGEAVDKALQMLALHWPRG